MLVYLITCTCRSTSLVIAANRQAAALIWAARPMPVVQARIAKERDCAIEDMHQIPLEAGWKWSTAHTR